jgi:monooxygenase
VSRPSRDGLARRLRRWLPLPLADGATRWKNVLLGMYFFSYARKRPAKVRAKILELIAKDLPGHDVERDFGPAYNPWDQRVCLVPDGDLFAAIRAGKVRIATGGIERFTPNGLALDSGERIEADIVVTATGLVVRLLGGIALTIDGVPVNVAEHFNYKGMMLSDVPNFALSFGYTNASWTLKCDLTSRYVCRLLRHMDRGGWKICVPRLGDRLPPRSAMLDFSSGYVQRAAASLPSQGPKPPWRVHQNYLKDFAALRFGRVADGTMHFGEAGSPKRVDSNGGARHLTFT